MARVILYSTLSFLARCSGNSRFRQSGRAPPSFPPLPESKIPTCCHRFVRFHTLHPYPTPPKSQINNLYKCFLCTYDTTAGSSWIGGGSRTEDEWELERRARIEQAKMLESGGGLGAKSLSGSGGPDNELGEMGSLLGRASGGDGGREFGSIGAKGGSTGGMARLEAEEEEDQVRSLRYFPVVVVGHTTAMSGGVVGGSLRLLCRVRGMSSYLMLNKMKRKMRWLHYHVHHFLYRVLISNYLDAFFTLTPPTRARWSESMARVFLIFGLSAALVM